MNINIGRAVSAGAIGTAMAMGSLVGHLVYGGVVGGVYGEAAEAKTAPAAV